MNCSRPFIAIFAAALFVGAAAVALDDGGPTSSYQTSQALVSEDQEIAIRVAAEWPRLRYSSPLGDVARGYAEACEFGTPEIPSSAAVRQLLKNAGLPESDAITATVLTTEEGAEDVLDHLHTVMESTQGVTHIGLDRYRSTQKPFLWRWAIVLVDRKIELNKPVPKRAQPGGALLLSFSPRADLTDPRVLVLYPGGQTRDLTPAPSRDTWFTVIPTGEVDGRVVVQILAHGGTGGQAIASMPVQVGRSQSKKNQPDTQPSTRRSDGVESSEEAENFLFAVVNDERQRHGLEPLEWDSALHLLARSHSADMRDNGFFGHISPTEGDLATRMKTGGYEAAVSRENLAKDIDLGGTHSSLMSSPGHRSNILADDVTRIGIGVTTEFLAGDLRHWIVAEIFALPLADVPATSAGYPETQESTCRRQDQLDELAQWLFSKAEPSGEIDDQAEMEFRRRFNEAGIPWRSMHTRFDYFATVEEAETAPIVGPHHFTLCGISADQVTLEDGRRTVLRVAILVEPRN